MHIEPVEGKERWQEIALKSLSEVAHVRVPKAGTPEPATPSHLVLRRGNTVDGEVIQNFPKAQCVSTQDHLSV